MSGSSGILIGLFISGIIIGIIISLAFSKRIRNNLGSRDKSQSVDSSVVEISNSEEPQVESPEISSGELRLIGVDERTAALVIASVCDHLKTPLDELQFKSIKAID